MILLENPISLLSRRPASVINSPRSKRKPLSTTQCRQYQAGKKFSLHFHHEPYHLNPEFLSAEKDPTRMLLNRGP